MTEEEWRDVAGYEGLYQVSIDGRLRSLPRAGGNNRMYGGAALRATADQVGYLSVRLSRNGRSRNFRVHALVAEAFLGPRPDGHEVRHLNGNPLNNHASNLAWGTRSENNLDAVEHGTHSETRKTHCPAGHPYEGENLRVETRDGGRTARHCRACRRVRRWGAPREER